MTTQTTGQRTAGTSLSAASARDGIATTNAAFMDAARRGDAAALTACYTDDAQLLPTHSDVVTGREAIEGFWRGAMEMGITGATLETAEVFESGADGATEIGRYTLFAAEGNVVDRGKYIVVWRRDADGRWKLHRDIWNTSQPPLAT